MFAYCALAALLLVGGYTIEEMEFLPAEIAKEEKDPFHDGKKRSYVIAFNEKNGENVIVDESIYNQIKEEFIKDFFSDKKILPKMTLRQRSLRRKQFGRPVYGRTTTKRPMTVNEDHLVIVNPVEAYANRQLNERELIRLMFTNGPDVKTSTWLPDYDEGFRKRKSELQKALEDRRKKEEAKHAKEGKNVPKKER